MRTGPESYSVAVCNRGPGALEFHPSRLVPKDGPGGPKLKLLATLRFEQVPRARACDPGFWALAFAQWVPGATEYHRAEVLYDVLLPWLAGGRISECLATEARFSRVWRTPCRSNTACMKNLLEALRLLTRSAPWRPLLAALRREALVLAAEELALQPLASPQATAALGVLEPYSSKLRLEQLPAKPAPTCKVIALFFSVPGNVSDEVHRRLSKLVTDVWDAHGGGALLVCECPLGEGPAREWAVCGDAGLARAYGLEAAQEPKVLLFRADGRMLTEEGLQTLVRDPTGKDFPWDPAGLAASDVALLRFGCRSVALRRKDAAELGRVAKAVHVLAVEAPLPEERRDLSWRLPGACDASSAALARGELLKAAEVEHFAGEAEPPHSTGFVDFMLPQVENARQAVAMLCHAAEVAKSSVRRSREASVSQRLVLEMETIAFVSSVVLDVLPPPDPDGGLWSTEISVEGANSEQRQGLRALLDLALLYAHCWQGLEAAERGAESERCLAAAKLLCAFDALLRRRGGSVLAELLFEESCSVHLGLCGDQRSLETVLQRLELLEPRWLLQRRGVLRYLAARERGCQRRIFELRQLGTAFEVRKYSATMNLLRKVLERLGLELMPRNGMMSEMEALGGWLFGRGAQLGDTCPELYWLRDMAALFKFLGTMEPRTAELLRKRRDTNEYQFWRLTFDAESSVRPGYGFGFEVPAIFWEVQGVRGHDQDIADVTATAFGRELTLGEGLVVQSPADVGKLLQRPSCTEEDVLHAPELPTFEETLSPDEAESLMSFLTVPYLQLPLVLDFFASQDRASYLFNPQLQRLLRAVLFEPRAFQESGVGANLVPAQKGEGEAEKLFGTSWGLLLSDLCHAPSSILDPLRRILGAVSELANAEANSSEAPFLLFGLELASDLLRFVEFANELQGSSVLREGSAWLRSFLQQLHGTVQRWPGSAAAGYCALHGFDSGQFAEAMASWCAVRTWHHFGCHETEEAGLTANQRLKRFLQAQGIDTGRTSEEMLNQFTRQDGLYRPVFLRVGQQTLRVPNFGHRRNEAGQTGVPEARLFRALQVHRSKILAAFLAAPEHLTPVAQAGLRAEPAELVALQWAHKGAGVFVADELQLSVQTGELLWREDGLKPLPDSMTRFEDFETIFGDASLQCGVVSRTRHRLWVHLVGKGFDLLEWDAAPQAAFKHGALGPEDMPAAPCARCGGTAGCWQCERCTMINCRAEGGQSSCIACGGPAPGEESNGNAHGMPGPFLRGAQRRVKVKPVSECAFLGQRYCRVLDVYEESTLPEPERWLLEVLAPVVLTLFPADPPDRKLRYQLLLPEQTQTGDEIRVLGFDQGEDPEKQEQGVAVASSEEKSSAATWKEILVSKTHRSVSVFNLVPFCRRFYRCLVFSSRGALALHNLPLDTPEAQKLLGAGGSFKEMRKQEGSLCIRRLNKELGLGESYISPRLLRGVVPSALLESYSFWDGEDGIIRGVPSNEHSSYFAKKLLVELEGEKFRVRRLAGAFPALRREQRRSTLARPARSAKPQSKVQEAEVRQLSELGFPMAACRLALETCGDAGRAAEWLFDEGNTGAIFAAVETEADGQEMAVVPAEEGPSAMELDEPASTEAWSLLDLLSAAEGSELAGLTELLVRVEDLSHILAWAQEEGALADRSKPVVLDLLRGSGGDALGVLSCYHLQGRSGGAKSFPHARKAEEKREQEEPQLQEEVPELGARRREANEVSLTESEGAVAVWEEEKNWCWPSSIWVEPDENRALCEEAEKLSNAGAAGAHAPDENSYEPEAGDLEAVRKVLLKRASRAVRKKRKRSDDSSGGASSSSKSEEEPEELFGCSTRPEEVGRRFPGVLAAEGIREMRASLLKNTGQLWDLEDGPLPPLSTMYFRQTLMSKMAPPMARETHTLCYGLDLLLQGRAAELGDLLVQRMKSLEGVAAGLHYSVMQKMELLPMDASRVARYTEVHDAARVARDEARALSAGSRAQGRGGSDSGWVPYGPRGRDEK
ncbi:unnamed protein product, partial [Effrenium voratum]